MFSSLLPSSWLIVGGIMPFLMASHADVGNVSDEVKEKYYIVNTDLAIENAAKAKFL